MAYIKSSLLGSAAKRLPGRARPPRDAAAVIEKILKNKQRLPRLPGRGTGKLPPFRPMPAGWSEANIGGPRHGGGPGKFDMSGDIMQMHTRGGPQGGPDGWMGQVPPQPQSNISDYGPPMGQGAGPDGGPIPPPGPEQYPNMPPYGMFGGGMGGEAQRPPWEGQMRPGGVNGINPKIMQLIMEMMGQRRGGGGGFGGGNYQAY